jgi:hypothetical protein
MATLSKAVLGRVSGSLGDITFRQRHGRNFLATRPASYSLPTDTDSILRRGRFIYSCKLSAGIISLPRLKTLWKCQAVDGKSEYNAVMSANYRFVTQDSITPQTLLSPGIGFRVTASLSEVDTEGIHVVLDPISSTAGIDTDVEKSLQLVSIISLSGALDDTVGEFAIIPLASQEQPVGLDGTLTFSLAFSSQESQLFQKYRMNKAMFALITIDADGTPVHYSSTFRG